ncbi:MAG: CDP-glycerol glycerophosphotransferase (TagB/SpsB family) [Halioglobus sp.]|jgi:CDP-glycerol glycerophosphotransferase (TagB/SpsB family)
MKIDRSNPKHWALLCLQGLYTLLAVVLRVVTPKPSKPIIILYGHQLSGNLKAIYAAWLKDRQDEFDFYFMSLDPVYSRTLTEQGVRVLRCASLLDMLMLTKCSVMITDHSLHLMTPLVRCTDICFVDVWHGIPFKGFIPSEFQLQHTYDEVWVSSSLLKSLYEDKFHFPPDTVHVTGYARTDNLFQQSPPDGNFREITGIPANQGIVLYAPTWQQDDSGRELFPFGESQSTFIQSLSEVCSQHQAHLVVRSHLNAEIEPQGFSNVHYCSMKDFPDTEDLLLQVDVLICDWSSISFDYLALVRPTLFLDVNPPFKHGFSLGSEYRFGSIIGDMHLLRSTLGDTLEDSTAFISQHSESYKRVTDAVYGTGTHGKAAKQQLDRLARLTGN